MYMLNENNFLDGIMDIDNNKELANKSSETEDLVWLETAHIEETVSYLDGIENIEVGSSLLLKSYASRGILEVVQKEAAGKQLLQSEMKLLWNFKRDFPSITFKELEAAANELRKSVS